MSDRIHITKDAHPNGHSANSTMNCLENGVCASIQINLNSEVVNGSQNEVSEIILNALSHLNHVDAIASVNIEIGDDESQ